MRRFSRFLRGEAGSGTISGLFWTVTAIMIAGIAVDGANGWRVQNQMQTAADAAALAAATKLTDLTAARALAVDVAQRNLGVAGIITADDVVFGKWDTATARFTATNTAPDAVQVTASRTPGRSNALSTYMLKFAGVPSFTLAARGTARGQSEPTASGCAGGAIISSGFLDAGGSNTYTGDVCLHGATGVRMGGNDWFGPDAHISATRMSTLEIYGQKVGSSPAAKVKVERTLAPVILPKLASMWTARWALYSQSATTYSGDLFPSFLKNPSTGTIRIVRKSSYWTIQQGELQPYTLYIVNGGAQFAGNVDAKNVGFIVNGYFGVGGGQNLKFDDIYVLGTQIGLAGNVTWGSQAKACTENRYSVYLLGTQSLSMGGWGQQTSIWGVLGVSPSFQPGGGMTATGVYFETSASSTSLGGAMTMNGCPNGKALSAEIETAKPPGKPGKVKSLLVN